MKRVLWNPWHGCHRCSPGCLHCYVYYFDELRGLDASEVKKVKTNFCLPLMKTRKGDYKIESGIEVATCFTSDFFLEEADVWREEVWQIIQKRLDVTFLICTKRIERFFECIPRDWGDGYPNVVIAVTCENQNMAMQRIPILLSIPAMYKRVFVSPILEYVNLTEFLKTGEIDEVSVGGESYSNARACDFTWVARIYEDCKKYRVKFDFHQTGSNFFFQGKHYSIPHYKEYSQAKKAMKYLREFQNDNRD